MSVYSFSAFQSKKPSFVLWLIAAAMCHVFKETHVAHYTLVNHQEWKYLPTVNCQYTMPEKRWQKNAWRPSSVATFILKLWFMTKCNGLPVPGNVKPVYISYYPLNHRQGCHASPRHSMWPAIIPAQTHPKRKNGRKRTHPKTKTDENGHTQNSKPTQTDGYPYQNGR